MNMCPTNKCKPPPELCLKGQVFFIYTNTQSLESVKDRISLLGGKVDPFLSRDVTTVLVEDNHLVGPQLLSPDLTVKAAYAPNGAVVTTFPYPNSLCSIPSTSRGYNFIATATNSSNSPYRIICYARQWGIKVLGIYQFLTWIEPQVKTATRQKKKATENVSLLTGYYIKFESLLKNYRPCSKMFTNDPNFLLPLKNANILVKPATCNVILEKPIGPRQSHITHMDKVDRPAHPPKGANFAAKPNERKPQNNKIKPKEESNYCECCKTHFTDLKQHIRSSRHQSFVSNEKNYESVHNILKLLPTPQEFIEKLQNPSPSSDLPVANGDISLCISSANIPETDYAMPLNFQMKRETVPTFMMPLDLHVEKNVSHVSPNLTLVKEEPLPLDLHVRRDYEVNIESKDKQETSLSISHGPGISNKKADANVVEYKIETLNNTFKDDDGKQIVQTNEEMQCDEINGDSLLDRTNTAALAQLCLKNFDSYWLDTLPCEMDDMVFDDIFDFDDGKSKVDNECPEPFVENFVAPVKDQISDIPNLSANVKSQAIESVINHSNNLLDAKDKIIPEAHNIQSIPSSSKTEKDIKRSVSPQNAVASCQDSYIGEKKQIFSIAAYCANKTNNEPSPSYSNTNPGKNLEILFSSESSDDDENGNVLISNALNFITNSDNEVRGEREIEENSLDEPPKQYYDVKKVCNDEVKTEIFLNTAAVENHDSGKFDVKKNSPLINKNLDSGKIDVQRNSVLINSRNHDVGKIEIQKSSPLINSRNHDFSKIDVQKNLPVTNSRNHDFSKIDVQKNLPVTNSRNPDSGKIDVQRNSVLINNKNQDLGKIDIQRNSVLVNSKNPALVQSTSLHEVKMDVDHCTKYNEIRPIIKDDAKMKTESFEAISGAKDSVSNEMKDSISSKQCSVSPRKCSYSDINSEMHLETVIPSKRIRSDEIKTKENDIIKDQESLSCKIKCDPESYEADKMKPLDMSSKKNCSNSFLSYGKNEVKEVKDNLEKKPVAINNMIAKEREDLDFKERYLIPKKKVSFYGMKSELASSLRHTPPVKTVPYENKIEENRYFSPVKGEKSTEKMKNQAMPVENCLISKTDIKKDVTETVKAFSPSPCQYSSRVEKYKAKVSANALLVQSTVKEKTIKIPQEKKSSKLRELPPLWSVSILPGSGVKLKFTCLQTKEKNNLQSDCRE